ncbi:MAG: hypothetical protein JW864_10015 [Spirochaetes bacterium]|nr:hypothetical protein [Spirochaetota bacterium]
MKGSIDMVNDNPALINTEAVKNTNIYKIPTGTFWWDLASGETVLLPLFLAKKFYPDIFKDWDLIDEMKYFYSEFYNYKISDKQVNRILLSQPPE